MASEPFNIKKVSKSEKLEILVLDDILPEYDTLDYTSDEEEKFINDLEKMVRNSFEYQEMVKYLRTYMDMNKCSFFVNINNIDTNAIKIHLHHSPITLMEIAVSILEKRKFYRENLVIEAVAKEVAYVHYLTSIGLIPLCETVHELVHNQFLFIPNSAVMGNWKWFVEQYKPFIPTQIRTKLDNIEKWSRIFNEAENKNVIEPHYIYLDLGDNGIGYNLPKMEQVKALVEGQINFIRSNGFQSGPIELVTWADPINKGGL